MNKTLALKSRLNTTFGVLSLFSVILFIISVVSAVVSLIFYGIAEVTNLSDELYNDVNFYLLFAIPQVFLPILTAAVGCLIPVFGKFSFKNCFKSEKVPFHYAILCVLIFPGLSTVVSYASYYLTEALKFIGIPIADIEDAIPAPNGAFQIFVLFFVMAVLPAICEELIYRGFVLRGLSDFGKTGAIVVSSIAFGLMHGTVQQIPFAFAIGLFLGYISLRFKSLILPVILHFINNFIACVIMVLQNYCDYETVSAISFCLDLFFITVSLLALAIFIILTVSDNKETKMKALDSVPCEADLAGESVVIEEKASFRKAVTRSWGFWLFTGIYLFVTVTNVVSMALLS